MATMQDGVYGQMSTPRPPEDQEIRNIIDKLASFVARNGPEFERMTMEKQRSNPKFNFLFGGEYNLYYRWKVTTEQAAQGVMPPSYPVPLMGGGLPPSSVPSSLPSSIPSLMSQTPIPLLPPHSLHSYTPARPPAAQPYLPMPPTSVPGTFPPPQQQPPPTFSQPQAASAAASCGPQGVASKDAPPPWIQMREQRLQKGSSEDLVQELKLVQAREQDQLMATPSDPLEVQFSSAVQNAMESCTKDSIAAGKTWIFSHAQNREDCDRVARYLMRKSLNSPGIVFSHKLHIIYLINDVVHHCVRKGAEDLKQAIEAIIVQVFYNVHSSNPDKYESLLKVLKIWDTQKYFDEKVLERIRAVVALTQEEVKKLGEAQADPGAGAANPWNKDAGGGDGNSSYQPWQKQQNAATSAPWSQSSSQQTSSAAPWSSKSGAPWQQRIQQLQQQVQQHLDQRQQDVPQEPNAQPTPLFPMTQHKKVPPANGGELQDQDDSPPEEHYSNSQRSDFQDKYSDQSKEDQRSGRPHKDASVGVFKGAETYDYHHGEGRLPQSDADGKKDLEEDREGLEVIDYNHQSRSRNSNRSRGRWDNSGDPSQSEKTDSGRREDEEGIDIESRDQHARGRKRWDADEARSSWDYSQGPRPDEWDEEDHRHRREDWDDDRRGNWDSHPGMYHDRGGLPPRMWDHHFPPPPPGWDRGNYPPWDGHEPGRGGSWDDRRPNWNEDRDDHRDDDERPPGWEGPPPGMPPWDGRGQPWDGRGPPPPRWDGPPMPPGPPWEGPPGPGSFGPPMGGFPPLGPDGPPPPPLPPVPSIPYYDLPAGIMVSVVRLQDRNYRPLHPEMMILPPPRPPTERLLTAVEEFYEEDKEGKRNHEGWEARALLGFFDAKNHAIEKLKKARRPFPLRRYRGSRSRSYSPKRRRRSMSYSRSRSRSRSPQHHRRRSSRSPSTDSSSESRSHSSSSSRSRSGSYSPRRRRSTRSRSFSPFIPTVKPPSRHNSTPPPSKPFPDESGPSRSSPPHRASPPGRGGAPAEEEEEGLVFARSKTVESKLEQDNLGHQLLKKMGWEEGSGLGAQMQGIEEPIRGGDVRDNVDKYKGLGINMKDPFEMFRKNKSFTFNNRSRSTT